ncbi:MAG: hypothetical protein QM820_17810 [Minicystis sp.]
MTRAELLEDLLVPFRSGKQDEPEAIGEHGIGFLSALEIAPRLEITTSTASAAHRLWIEPIGSGPPYADFVFELEAIDLRRRPAAGTSVRLLLDRPVPAGVLSDEIFSAAGLVETAAARIFVDGEPVNTARARLRRVARVPIAGGALGELELLVGRGDRIAPRFVLTQKGLLVIPHLEPFGAPDLSLHRDLLHALTTAGYGLVADLPLAVPLTKGRAAPAASAAGAVLDALTTAFERFVLEDALYDRELLRGVDHRLAAVLDRLVATALRGEAPPPEAAAAQATSASPTAERPSNVPTVAAPESVVRFASALVDAPMFVVSYLDPKDGETRAARSLREMVDAHRRGVLRAGGYERDLRAGLVYLASADPLSLALFRRLTLPAAPPPPPDAARPGGTRPMPRVARDRLLTAPEHPRRPRARARPRHAGAHRRGGLRGRGARAFDHLGAPGSVWTRRDGAHRRHRDQREPGLGADPRAARSGARQRRAGGLRRARGFGAAREGARRARELRPALVRGARRELLPQEGAAPPAPARSHRRGHGARSDGEPRRDPRGPRLDHAARYRRALRGLQPHAARRVTRDKGRGWQILSPGRSPPSSTRS